jgi:hypothetical protein
VIDTCLLEIRCAVWSHTARLQLLFDPIIDYAIYMIDLDENVPSAADRAGKSPAHPSASPSRPMRFSEARFQATT